MIRNVILVFAADRYRSRFFVIFAKDHGWLYWITGVAVGKSKEILYRPGQGALEMRLSQRPLTLFQIKATALNWTEH